MLSIIEISRKMSKFLPMLEKLKGSWGLTFHLFLLGLCGWGVWIQLKYRIVGNIAFFIIPLVALAVASLNAIVLIVHLMGRTPIEEPFNLVFNRFERLSRLFLIVFCYYSLFVFANAKLDSSVVESKESVVIEMGRGEITLDTPVTYSWVKLRSWDNSEWTVRHFLNNREAYELWVGQKVVIQLREGYFDVPWVQAIAPNKEKTLRTVLIRLPTAAKIWKELVSFYLEQHRWEDAVQATGEYLEKYPNDYHFADGTADTLYHANRFQEMVTLLEPLAARRQHYRIFCKLGFGMMLTGRKVEGVKVLRSAINLHEDDWFAYYALGYGYLFSGEPRAAIPVFEKVLEVRPEFPEIKHLLGRLRNGPGHAR